MIELTTASNWLEEYRSRESFEPLSDAQLKSFIIENVLDNNDGALAYALPEIMKVAFSMAAFTNKLAKDVADINEQYNATHLHISETGSIGGGRGLERFTMLGSMTQFVGIDIYVATVGALSEYVDENLAIFRDLANNVFKAA